MTFFVWVAIGALLLAAAQAFISFHLAKLRRVGHYPERGKAAMADVEQLLNMGSRGLAVRCYREIHACSLRQAGEATHALSTKGKSVRRNHTQPAPVPASELVVGLQPSRSGPPHIRPLLNAYQ